MATNPDENWFDENVGGFFDAIGRKFEQTFLQTDADKYADVMKQVTEQPWPSFGSDGFQGIWSELIAIAIALLLLVLISRIIPFVRSKEASLVTDSVEDTLMLVSYAFYGLVGVFALTTLSDAFSHLATKLFYPDGTDAAGQPWYSGVLAVIGSVQDPQAKILESASIDMFVALFASSMVVMSLGTMLTLVFLPTWRTSIGNFFFRWSLALALTTIVAKPFVILWLAFSVKQAELFPMGQLNFSAPMMPSMPSWTTTIAGLIIVVTFFALGGFIGKNPRLRSNRWKEVHADKLNAKGGFGVPAWGMAGGLAASQRAFNRRMKAQERVRKTDGSLQRTSMRADSVATAAKGAQTLVAKRAAAKAATSVAAKTAAGAGVKAGATAAAGTSAVPPLAVTLGVVAGGAAVVSNAARKRSAMRHTTNSRTDRIRRSPTRM